MSARQVVVQFWEAMEANNWQRAAEFLAADCVVDWPCSGERILGRRDYAAMQARYPTTTGRWTFDVHRLIAEVVTVVSEVTASDGVQSARLVAFSEVDGDVIRRQVEYWPMAYAPPPGREDLTQPIDHVP
jgi:limonene-1,2-epoxide hydrolase